LIPVYWDEVEPEEGKFDFTSVDALIASARRHDVKLIPLWFATWKNGNMDFHPILDQDQHQALQAGDIPNRQRGLGTFFTL